jgi:hypothetical protein
MPVNLIRDADIRAISIVDKGANRKRFFLTKSDGEQAEVLTDTRPLLKSEDWSVAYCVVAEPGWHEGPGIGAEEPHTLDRWADEDEIRKAAHRFMRNGGLVNKLHESLEPYGQLVENAVALDDFTVNGETIAKGSWYIAIAPSDEGRQAIDKGEFTGISIEGMARRELVEKASEDDDHAACDACLLHPKKGTLKKGAGKALPGLDKKPGKSNWVDEAGGLPDLIDRAARHLHSERGRPISAAIATAVNWAKKGCATGTAFGGKVKVSKPAQARMCAAVAEWEAKKKSVGVKKAKGERFETVAGIDAYLAKANGSTRGSRSVGSVAEETLLQRIAKKVGLSEEEIAVEKTHRTFGEIIARREFDEMLPEAFNAFREAVSNAFFPAPGEEADPIALITESCDEFKAWALDKLDTVPVEKAQRADALGVALDGSTPQMPTFDREDTDMGLTDKETARIEKLETAVEKIGDGVTKLIEKSEAETEDKAPTAEELNKQLGEVTDSVKKLGEDIAKLGDGGTTQTETETTVTKQDAEAVAKAFESKGVNPALAGVMG